MTPKEKAKELVSKYEYLVNTWDCYNDEPLEIEYKLPEMKKCALIAVDEILFSNNTIFETNIPHECWKYWQEVKQEIEKL